MESTFEPLKEFEKSDAANILISQYFVEKNERAVYGFYLLKSGDASFYYPAFVKNINEGNIQLFIYNYCYHSYEIINDKRFEKNKFLSCGDLPGRFGGICVLSLRFNGIGQNLRENIDINYNISFEVKTNNSYSPARVYVEDKKPTTKTRSIFSITELVLKADLKEFEVDDTEWYNKMRDDFSEIRSTEFYNNMEVGYENKLFKLNRLILLMIMFL